MQMDGWQGQRAVSMRLHMHWLPRLPCWLLAGTSELSFNTLALLRSWTAGRWCSCSWRAAAACKPGCWWERTDEAAACGSGRRCVARHGAGR